MSYAETAQQQKKNIHNEWRFSQGILVPLGPGPWPAAPEAGQPFTTQLSTAAIWLSSGFLRPRQRWMRRLTTAVARRGFEGNPLEGWGCCEELDEMFNVDSIHGSSFWWISLSLFVEKVPKQFASTFFHVLYFVIWTVSLGSPRSAFRNRCPRHPGYRVTLVPHLLAEYLGSYRFCNYSRSITLIHGKRFDPFFHTALLFALTFRAFALHFKESNLTRELRTNDLSMILLLVYFIANFFAHPMASSSMNVCSNRGLSPQKC